MKKLCALLCALTILLAAAAAESLYTASCFGVPVLSVRYDSAAFRLDTESYLSASYGGHVWLGMFYNGACTVELSADRADGLYDAAQLAGWAQSALAADQPVWLEEYTGLGGVSYALFRLNTQAGPAYYAAALSQGWVVHFEIYNLRGGVDESALGTLRALLDGTAY